MTHDTTDDDDDDSAADDDDGGNDAAGDGVCVYRHNSYALNPSHRLI